MNVHKQNESLKERNKELKRTIRFLCNTIQDLIEEDYLLPEPKLVLKEAINDPRYTFK